MSLQKYPSDLIKNAYLIDTEEIFQLLHTSDKGLKSTESKLRIEGIGKNLIKKVKKDSLPKIFLKNFTEPLILLLMASAAISFIIGETEDAIGIAVAISLVVILGFTQEYRSERSVEALKKLITHKSRVMRDGEVIEVLAEELVPGDIVLLNTGDRIPADMRLFESNELQIDESILTGESEPSMKTAKKIKKAGRLLANLTNMAYLGTVITKGNGRGVVTGTGDMTELGKISLLIQKTAGIRTPLQLKLDELGKHISLYAIFIIVLISSIGVVQGNEISEMFTVAISLAVAAIPEGLPIVVTITLALGVRRVAKRKAIIRKLPAVESLGSTTVICTDKTGTLTQNEMTVKRIYTHEFIEVTGVGYDFKGGFLKGGKKIDPGKDKHLLELLNSGMLCNNAYFNDGLIGQPTEGALLTAALKAGLQDKRAKLRRVEEKPFDSEKKWMMVSVEKGAGTFYHVKGATDRVLEKCGQIYSSGLKERLTDEKRGEILWANKQLADSTLRVIALAHGRSIEELTFLGLVGIMDPPRENVKESIKEVMESGVKVVMITGDSKETALAVSKELGFYDVTGIAMSGGELEKISDEEFSDKISRVNVFYRTSPEHKLKIVKAYQKKGHIVAMTGDGVNDAPALKVADIGIAMGEGGTDVAKEASEMILVDNNFAIIVSAIEEGKSIYNNIKNFLRFELTTSVAALSIIAFSTLLGFPLPLNPIQILWINIIMDGPPAQSLGVEPMDADLMKHPPRNPKESVITRRVITNILLGAGVMIIGTLSIFFLELGKGSGVEKRAVTMAFTVFVMFQMFNALNCRSEEKSIFKLGFFSNKYVLLAIAASIFMQLAVLYVPLLQFIFGTVTLSVKDLALVTAVAGSVFVVDEIRKKVF
jgi:Ca2+-transporting ATPase